MIVIVMGVSGCGKSLIGELLAQRLDCPFVDGDAFHSPANKAKMAHGIPLNDADRWPWLAAIHEAIAAKLRTGEPAVFACSALKRAYRDALRGDSGLDGRIRFVYLKGSFELLRARLGRRTGHFFDPALLRSQFDALEEPGADEAFTVDVDDTPATIVGRVVAGLTGAPIH